MRAALFGLLFVAAATPAWALKPFQDLYAEGVFLSSAKTTAGLLQYRFGVPLNVGRAGWETYAIGRIGGDTRTYLEKSDNVFNDNFLFTGAGIDFTGLFPGIRFLLQLGYSFDLNKKINRGGLDGRLGFITFHEANKVGDPMTQELYTESIYVHRYRNFLAGFQWRLFNDFLKNTGTKHELGPLLATAISVDSKGFDYNRFVELRVGARWRMREWLGFSLMPQYVWGTRWNMVDMNSANYRELRALVVFGGYW